MSDVESLISDLEATVPMDPPLFSEDSASSSMFSSIRRSRKLARAISIFKREAQMTSAKEKPAVTDPLAVSDSNSDPDAASPPSLTEYFDLASLTDVQPYLTPATPEQNAEIEVIWTNIHYAQRSFELRVEAPPTSPLNVSPNSRESFEAMVWALLIMDHPTLTNRDASVPTPIPIIKSLYVYNILVPSTPDTRTKANRLNIYFKRTEILLQLYTLPPNVTTKLAEIATKINGSKFARYMGSRGPWSLRRAFGGLQVLLHWWAATSPCLMVDFANAVSLHSKTVEETLRTTLRAELTELFDIDQDQKEDEKTLDTAISRGYDEISMFRRELRTVVQDAFEDLVERARAAEVDDDSKTLSAGE